MARGMNRRCSPPPLSAHCTILSGGFCPISRTSSWSVASVLGRETVPVAGQALLFKIGSLAEQLFEPMRNWTGEHRQFRSARGRRHPDGLCPRPPGPRHRRLTVLTSRRSPPASPATVTGRKYWDKCGPFVVPGLEDKSGNRQFTPCQAAGGR